MTKHNRGRVGNYLEVSLIAKKNIARLEVLMHESGEVDAIDHVSGILNAQSNTSDCYSSGGPTKLRKNSSALTLQAAKCAR